MDYRVAGVADTTTLHKPGLVPAADGQRRGEPPSETDDLQAFSKAISLQAEARAARYAIGESHFVDIQRKIRNIEREEGLSLGRSLNLVLVFALGVAVYAGIMYVILGTQLRSPLPSPTPPLPPPGATA
jgi:hypothetical protein